MPLVGSIGVTKMQSSKKIPEALAQFDTLPDSAFIRLPVMKVLYGVCGSSIYRNVAKGIIPKPSKLTPRTTTWNVGQVRAALAAKAGVSDV